MSDIVLQVAGELDLQRLTDGRLDAAILRQLLIALAMIAIMLARPRGLWPSPEHGKGAPAPVVPPNAPPAAPPVVPPSPALPR